MPPESEVRAWLAEIRQELKEVTTNVTRQEVHIRALIHRVNRLEKGALWIIALVIATLGTVVADVIR